jgi:PKD repeat protein
MDYLNWPKLSFLYQKRPIKLFVLFLLISNSCQGQGLHGYISSNSFSPPVNYDAGVGFYSAIWTLTPKPIAGFQIGLPSTWITPNNSDNNTGALCPIGTYARDNWPQHAPTWDNYFQTIEGGPGYWVGNRFHYGPPKFSMNSTPNCYTNQVASPGWPFFGSNSPLVDSLLGIAQLSNRMLIPPDGLPFEGEPNGELLGLSYLAMPFTPAKSGTTPVGDQSWTLFLNSTNFKGPLAYFLPEQWSKISNNYPFDNGRGLDARPMNDGIGGSMEINTVPHFLATDGGGTVYSKIPLLQFPVDSLGRTILTRDITYYSKQALFNDVLAWRLGGATAMGTFNTAIGGYTSNLYTWPVTYTQDSKTLLGINSLATPSVFGGTAFGLQWSSVISGMGKFPEYFQDNGTTRQAIDSVNIPVVTGLGIAEFNSPNPNPNPYNAPLTGIWGTPGPVLGPYNAFLADGSIVTYYWYRFIDQPVFQQFNWSQADRDSLQVFVEGIHQNWTISQSYMPAPSGGALVTFDTALLVVPPVGYEVGYVPIVTRQGLAPKAPEAHLAQHQNLLCGAGFQVTFSDTSLYNDTSLVWLFPGGIPSSSTSSTELVQYATAGPHVVTLVASNSYGTDTLIQVVELMQGTNTITLHLTTDNYPDETGIYLLDASGVEIYLLDTFAQTNNSYTFPLCLLDGCYTFRIKDRFGDGICCAYGLGHYELMNANGDTLKAGGDFAQEELFQFCVGNMTNIEEVEEEQELLVFPNPSADVFNLQQKKQGYPKAYILTDVLGKELKRITIDSNISKLDLSIYPSGVYFLNSEQSSNKSYKLIKQ